MFYRRLYYAENSGMPWTEEDEYLLNRAEHKANNYRARAEATSAQIKANEARLGTLKSAGKRLSGVGGLFAVKDLWDLGNRFNDVLKMKNANLNDPAIVALYDDLLKQIALTMLYVGLTSASDIASILALITTPQTIGLSLLIKGILKMGTWALTKWVAKAGFEIANDVIIDNKYKMLKKITGTEEPEFDHPDTDDITPIVDPSGYVYEGVVSNRISGVTMSVYQKTIEYDIYEEAHEVITLWDAVPYGQINPQLTMEDGTYGWDVPDGWWQVQAEHPDYETYYTEWMEVPPERKDVFIGLVSKAAPAVQEVLVTETEINVAFSRYVKADALHSGALSILIDGQPVSGSVTLVNGEANPANPGETLVSKVKFTPSQPLTVGAEIELRITDSVISYADVAMEGGYSGRFRVLAPEAILTDSELKLLSGSEGSIEISAQPAEVTAGMKVSISCDNAAVALDASSVTLDAAGRASVKVSCAEETEAVVSFAVEGTELTAQTALTVVSGTLTAEGVSFFTDEEGSLVITAQPAEATAGRKVIVFCANEYVRFEPAAAVLDENGQATVKVSTAQAIESVVTVALEGAGLTA